MKVTPHNLPRIALMAALWLGSIALASAADRYQFNFSLSGKTTNDARLLVTVPASKATVLRETSADTAIPVAQLALIYERSSGLVLVVDREFGTNVTTVFRMRGELAVGNTNQTRFERFLELDHPLVDNFNGTGVATEHIRRDTLSNETGWKLSGHLHLAIEEQDGDRTQIYKGTFSTGAPFVPRQ